MHNLVASASPCSTLDPHSAGQCPLSPPGVCTGAIGCCRVGDEAYEDSYGSENKVLPGIVDVRVLCGNDGDWASTNMGLDPYKP